MGFLEEAERLLGAEAVQREGLDDYFRNVCGQTRQAPAVLYPQTTEGVQALVGLARQHRQPLYPLSRGRSWGLGSRLPVGEGQIVVDLSRMRRILDFDAELGLIHIQAGCSQAEVAEHVAGSAFVLNVTGSSRDSSVVGNALDRGVAHYGCRVREIVGLEAVLGDGEILRAGGRHYPFGLGPDLRGLFFQSNYAIVTSAWVKLRPRTALVAVASTELEPKEELAAFVDQLAGLVRQRLLPENLHISNRPRRRSVVAPLYARQLGVSLEEAAAAVELRLKGGWAALSSLETHPELLPVQLELLRRTRSFAVRREDELAAETDPLALATQGTFGHSCGRPGDDAIPSVGFAQREVVGSDPAESDTGLLFLVPILPLQGAAVAAAVALVERAFQAEGFELFATFNLCEEVGLEGVLNLTFDRRQPERGEAAHRAVRSAFRALLEHGYPPQRMSIFQFADHPLERPLGGRLKQLFDPDGILAPGRYE